MRACALLLLAAFASIAAYACSGEGGSAAGGAPDGGSTSGDTRPADLPRVDGGGPDAGGPDAGSDVTSPPPSRVNTTTETVDVDGRSRRYVLSVPKAYDRGRSYPLVLALHGDGQDAASFVGFLGIEAFSGDDAVVAYPDQSVDLFTPYARNNDQRLIERIVEVVKAKLSIDASKIWALGYSKGGYQLNEIACKRPGLIKAMAIHAGGAPQARTAGGDVDCPAATALPVFVTHGEHDDPAGGEFGADYWARLAGCRPRRTRTTPPICESYNGCPADKPVVFCVVPGQPHYPLYGEAAAHSWAWFRTL